MKTMEKLVNRFNRMFKDCFYKAELMWQDSYEGFYTVGVVDPLGMCTYHHFRTCNEFREWMDGVVLE